MAYLLDTDVVIDVLRGRASPTLRRKMTEEAGRLAITTVTLSELVYGAAQSTDPARNRRAIREFTPFVVVLDLDADAAEHAGEIRASLATTGTPIDGYDLLIAGVARLEASPHRPGSRAVRRRALGRCPRCWGNAQGGGWSGPVGSRQSRRGSSRLRAPPAELVAPRGPGW
ncbi:type II toxin-antitoxin system VapC family toxin [Marihabitans asiaticum]|uniref:type II toxin-antitoxin system VapC family toxin n=2 Tax=Marihabitans asiaticum TaxID=415218 RepID=UPI001B88111B|nr:type II toxin-antitoxin system VapC family toxin [Marihabitans asiaticum]